MPARCIPEQPTFKVASERRVWQALKKRLRESDVLLANTRFVGEDGNWETDLILLMPEGFATIEVKGGYVHRSQGRWLQETPDGVKALDLDEQAVSEMYLVRRYLQHRWSFGNPRMAHFVALPDTEMGPDDPSPGLPRNRVLTKNELTDAAGRIHDVLRGRLHHEPKRGPGPDGVDAAADLLGGVADPVLDVQARIAMREAHLNDLARLQYPLLDFIEAVPRYDVTGGPGTGKTWLAVEQTRRWAEDGNRVAYVCYSRGLATWVQRRIVELPQKVARNIQASTFHALGVGWGADVPPQSGPQFWEHDLPERMLHLSQQLPESERFDALVVDEAQDFADSWWPPLLRALRRPEAGPIAVFGDDGQRIFGRTGKPNIDLVPLHLHRNLRNTRQIAALFQPMAGVARPEVLAGNGPEVRFLPCSPAEAVQQADEAAVALLDEGWGTDQVALLTTHHRHPVQLERQERYGQDGYWESFWDASDLFYGTVLGFKGLERPVVVLAVDGFRDESLARDILYVGLSRARDLLVVCGDAAQIEAIAGKEVAKRLSRSAA